MLIFIVIANVIVDGGFSTSLIQTKEADNKDYSTVFFASLGIAFVIYIFFYLSAPYIASFFDQPSLVLPLRVISLSLFFYAGNSVQRAFAVKRLWFRKLFYSNLIATLISGIIGICMAYNGWGIWALVALTLSNIALTCLSMAFFIKWKPQWCFSNKSFLRLFDFGWKIFLTNLIITVFVRVRGLIIGKKFTPNILAFYSKGEQFPNLISDNVFGSIQTVLFPAFSEYQEDRNKIKSMMRRSISISCLILFPSLIGLTICAKPLVLLLLSNEWLPCVPFIQILCIANIFCPITIPNNQAIMAMGYSNITLKLEIIRKIIDISILIISCLLGIYAIAWGVVLYNFICLFINLYPNQKLLNIRIVDQLKEVFPSFICSLIMGGVIVWILFLPIKPVAQLFLLIISGVIVYIVMCRIINNQSYAYLKQLLKERLVRKK